MPLTINSTPLLKKIAKIIDQTSTKQKAIISFFSLPLIDSNKVFKYIKSDPGFYKAIILLKEIDSSNLSSKPP